MATMNGDGKDGTLIWGGKPKFTTEERRENGRKGGLKMGENRAKRRKTQEILQILLDLPINTRKKITDIEEIQSLTQLNGKNITVAEMIQVQQVKKALKGDLNSATYIRDTVGEKPVEKVEAKVENPVKNLTTEELRELIKRDSEGDNKRS